MPDETKELEKQISLLQKRIAQYEDNGAAKLYYALQRKMNEIADILNNTKLNSLSLDDPKDKTFERLKVLWTDSKSISETVKILGENAGVTGDEKKDTEKQETITAESMSNVLGNSAGKRD